MNKYQKCADCPHAEIICWLNDDVSHFNPTDEDVTIIRCKIMGWDKFSYETCGSPRMCLHKSKKSNRFFKKIILMIKSKLSGANYNNSYFC